MTELHQAVSTVIRRCLGVKAGEDVLVIVDPETRSIGEALRDEASDLSADAVLAVMDERATDGTEPPRTLAAALAECDVFIAPDHPVAQPHDRAQAGQRRRRPRGHDAGRDRGHARRG